MFVFDILMFVAGTIMTLIGYSSNDKGLFKWVWSNKLFDDTELSHLVFMIIGKVFLIIGMLMLLFILLFYNPNSNIPQFVDEHNKVLG